MREILFRGKRKDNGEWVEGFYLVAAGIPFISTFGVREPIPVVPETVGQFTGLCDKKGKKIWEGNAVKFYEKFDGKIVYRIGGFFFEEENGRHTPLQILNTLDCEVNCITDMTGWYVIDKPAPPKKPPLGLEPRSLWCVFFENTSQPEESGFTIYVVADSRADAKDIAMAKALKTHKYEEIKITNSVRVESEEKE